MANRSTATGTKAETRIVNWLKGRDFNAKRIRQHGSVDHGDIEIEGYLVILQSKWTRATPTAGMVDGWLAATSEQAEAVTIDRFPHERLVYYPVLVCNRQRSTDVAHWIWYVWSPRELGFLRRDGYGFIQTLLDDVAFSKDFEQG